jgi:hypothetical protein
MSLGGRLVMGGAFTLAGIAMEAVALGMIPVDPSSIHAPMWVIGTAATVFILPGLWILFAGTTVGRVLEVVVGPVVLVGLLSVLHWVAFGAGVRQCTGGFSIPFFSARGPVGDLECRVAFGYGALLFDGILAGTILSSFAKKKLEGRSLRLADGVASALIFIPLAPFILLVALMGLVKGAIGKVRG